MAAERHAILSMHRYHGDDNHQRDSGSDQDVSRRVRLLSQLLHGGHVVEGYLTDSGARFHEREAGTVASPLAPRSFCLLFS